MAVYSVCYTVLQDLINCTPTSHADYDILQNALSSAQYFIENFDGTSYKEQVCLSCTHQALVACMSINYFKLREVSWVHSVELSAAALRDNSLLTSVFGQWSKADFLDSGKQRVWRCCGMSVILASSDVMTYTYFTVDMTSCMQK